MQLDLNLKKHLGTFDFNAECTLKGDRIGIFGPSGSGKSTLMHLVAGLMQPDEGVIQLNDTLLFHSKEKINLPPDKRRIGVVFQHSRLFPHMSVQRNLLYGWNRTPVEQRRLSPESIIKVMHLDTLMDRGVNLLSGGERQRVALARTVLTCPRLILMDEPLTGLDEELKFHIIPYLNKVFHEFSIPLLFISHSLMEMRLMTDQVLVVEQGRILREVATEELAKSTWAAPRKGYANLLRLGRPQAEGDLWKYRWGNTELTLTEHGDNEENVFELDARDVILFKRHPEATSARNLLPVTVGNILTAGNRVRLEIHCGDQQLIVQIVPESVRELQLSKGMPLIAAIKASSFRKLI